MIIKKSPRRFSFSRSFLASLPIFFWILVTTSATSILGFILFSIIPKSADYVILVPEQILHGRFIWTLLTHIFFHADFLHLFVNMFSLLFIGSVCETIIGKKRFIWFYLISGIAGGVFFVLFAYLGSLTGLTSVLGDINLGGVGASGALFGLLGILAIIIPNKKVYLISGPIILIIIQIILPQFISGAVLTAANVITTILLFMMIFSLFYHSNSLKRLSLPIEMPIWVAPIAAIVPLVSISFFVSLPIGNSAHLGGLLIGLIYGIYLRFNYPRKVEIIGRFFR